MTDTIIFESPGKKSQPEINEMLRLGCRVIVLEPFSAYHHRGGIRFYPPVWPPFISELIHGGKLEVLSAKRLGSENIYFAASERAVVAVERVYPGFRAKFSSLIDFTVQVLGDKDAELMFKKYLADQLGDFFSLNILLERVDSCVGPSFQVYPHSDVNKYIFYLGLVQKSGVAHYHHSEIDFPKRLRERGRKALIRKSVLIVCKIFGQAAASLVRDIFRKDKSIERKRYRYAATLVAPGRQLRGNRRGAGFFVDGKEISTGETVILPLVSLTPGQREELNKAGYDVLHPPRIDRCFSDWRHWFSLFRSALAANPLTSGAVVELAALALITTFRWQNILKQIEFRNFISHCDFSSAHIARNVLFKKNGVTTWYFTDAVNFGHNFRTSDKDWVRHPFWSYMYYDNFVTWNQDLATYFSMHPGAMKQSHVVGCLWAQHVERPANRDQEVAHLFGLTPEHVFGKTVIVAYTSTYTVNGVTSFSEGIEFVQHLERLVIEIPEILVLVKEKKDKNQHLRLDPVRGRNLLDAYRSLDGLQRATVCSKEIDASFVMGTADLIISFPFTSTTSEAIGAGKNAIWHDPSGNYRNTPFGRDGRHVTHSYEQLHKRVADLVAGAFVVAPGLLEQSPLFDPFRDGRAIDRFRQLLLAAGE